VGKEESVVEVSLVRILLLETFDALREARPIMVIHFKIYRVRKRIKK
jgi:hypothetical protein